MSFTKVFIPKSCLEYMRSFTLSDREWGGQLHPKWLNGRCVLDKSDRLIKGTPLVSNHVESKHYRSKSTQIATTPFTSEIYQISNLCQSDTYINVIWHTHSLFFSSHENYCQYLPPSLGDFVVHTVLGNIRNWRENNLINTTMVMSFEGLYVYFVQPKFLMEVMAYMEAQSMSASDIKSELMTSLHPIDEIFAHDMVDHIHKNPSDFLFDSFKDFVENDVSSVDFINTHYTRLLKTKGFDIHFYPTSSFKDGIEIIAPCKMPTQHNT